MTSTSTAKRENSYLAQQSTTKPWNPLAVLGFILSFLMPIAGLIVSILAMRSVDRTAERGYRLSIAGVLLNSIFIGATVVYFACMIGLAVYAAPLA